MSSGKWRPIFLGLNVLNCIFPVMEWSTHTKNRYDDLEVYMVCGYVSVSTTGRNHAKMAPFSFNVS